MTVPLKFLITSFFDVPVLPEATAEVLAIPLALCSVIEKLALLSCRVSSAIIRLALWLIAVWFKCFANLLTGCLLAVSGAASILSYLSLVDSTGTRSLFKIHSRGKKMT